ncbi:regulatory protein RecX [Paenibacillus abyssi]|uniref:Regulatory protein RecX n=1 Tax=Paenibacillus abyssi TaxID=1340531 RepID=A0A917D7S7_9BACL|nr:RecX family transcriptional regulator [Paenibacillus abyssi]GGG11788.1 regulatory protein RecX [Paenibacillus abyssi]
MNFGKEEREDAFRITSVERDLKKRDRYFIYADHSEEPILSVHEDILIEYTLLKGHSVSVSDLPGILEADQKQNAYTLALAYLGMKPRTRKEIERYLIRKEIAPEVIEQVANRLEAEHTIDDGDYAKRFAEQRLRNHLKGRLSIKQELLQRGVSKSQAAEAISELDEDFELEAAVRAGGKKWPFIKGETRDRIRKLTMFLMRRGYPGGVVREAVKQVMNDKRGDE